MTPSAQSYSRRAPVALTCMLTCKPPQAPGAMTGLGLGAQPTAAKLMTIASAEADLLTLFLQHMPLEHLAAHYRAVDVAFRVHAHAFGTGMIGHGRF